MLSWYTFCGITWKIPTPELHVTNCSGFNNTYVDESHKATLVKARIEIKEKISHHLKSSSHLVRSHHHHQLALPQTSQLSMMLVLDSSMQTGNKITQVWVHSSLTGQSEKKIWILIHFTHVEIIHAHESYKAYPTKCDLHGGFHMATAQVRSLCK